MIQLGLDFESLRQNRERPSVEQAQVVLAAVQAALTDPEVGLTAEQQKAFGAAVRRAMAGMG